MKKLAFLLVVALIWGCQDRVVTPAGPDAIDNSGAYGSSVVKLPALNGLAKAAQGVTWKFTITITGPGMDPMTFSYALNGRDTAITIDKIPAGQARLFTGTLYGSNGARYEGTAVTEIQAGRTAFVTLYLRQTGSAQVDVIIEGVNDNAGPSGCFILKGTIDTLTLVGFSFKVLEPSGNPQMWTYVYQFGEMVGKFWGGLDSRNSFSGQISIPGIFNGVAMVKGIFDDNYTAFKCDVFSIIDTTRRIGSLYGGSTPCDTITPPPSTCWTDTIGNSTTCNDNATWAKIAQQNCVKAGLKLTTITFWDECEGPDSLYKSICYECCGVPKN